MANRQPRYQLDAAGNGMPPDQSYGERANHPPFGDWRAGQGERDHYVNPQAPVGSGSTVANGAAPEAARGADNNDKGSAGSRQSRACLSCRKQKMRCIVQDEETCCRRCAAVGRECIFVASLRGRKSEWRGDAESKTDHVAASLKSLEASLQTVLSTFVKLPTGTLTPNSQPEHEEEPKRTAMFLSEAPLVAPPRNASGEPMQITSEDPDTAAAMLLLHGLPHPSLTPLGLLADASIQNQRKRSAHVAELDGSEDKDDMVAAGSARGRFGVANVRYFQSASSLRRLTSESSSSLALFINKVVTPAEVSELFTLYFNNCHPAAPILDPEIHSVAGTAARSPFLLLCVCTVASRYYPKRGGGFYRECLTVAKSTAADIIIKGLKSIEIVLGFFLLCQWNQPAERFSEEISFAFSGIAIRQAIDLNLHCKSLPCPPGVTDENRIIFEREMRSGEQAWLYAYICDRSISNQLGKPYAISRDDLIVRNSDTWHLHPGALPRDAALCGAVSLQKIITRALDVMYSDMRSTTGLNNNLDYPRLMRSFLGQLDGWHAHWKGVFIPHDILDFLHSYYRLFLLSFAIQHALSLPDPTSELSQYSALCFESASMIITTASAKLEPSGSLRHAIDCTFVFLTYASCFLLKVINPIFIDMVSPSAAMGLVEQGAQALERSAVDATHTPAIYACFLRALMKSKQASATVPATRAASPESGNPVFQSDVGSSTEFNGESNFSDNLDLGGADDLDALLNGPGSFWDNMLMPGFGGPIQGLNGGTLYPFAVDPWDMIPSRESRPVSPFGAGSFDFHQAGI